VFQVTLIPSQIDDTTRRQRLARAYALLLACAMTNETAEPGELLAEEPGTAEAGKDKTVEQLLPVPN
jgi:hypothetical protein